MSETKLHFIGDSNVDRYLAEVKSVEEDPYLTGATMTRAVNLLQLQEALSTPVELHKTVVVAALTNPTTSHVFTNFTGVKAHCDQVFAQVQAWINDGRTAVPGAMQKVPTLILAVQGLAYFSLSGVGLFQFVNCLTKNVVISTGVRSPSTSPQDPVLVQQIFRCSDDVI
jgi:hypothetical protein